MKKLLIILISALIVITPFFKSSDVMAYNASSDKYISAEEIAALTEDICTSIPDRTSFSDACRVAAERIAGESSGDVGEVVALSDDAEYLSRTNMDIEIRSYTEKVTVQSGFAYNTLDITAYNVVATPKIYDPDKKVILIATDFTDHYASIEDIATKGTGAEGALGTAATTALLIKLANYLSRPEVISSSPYNYEFVFFSGTDEGNFGSEAYVKDMDKEIMLMINLERLGCGNTYFYTDEAETEHGKFIKQFAADSELKEFPLTGRVLLPMTTVDDLPYSHYAMKGNNATFMSRDIACLELLGGDFRGLTDREGGEEDLTNTNMDTFGNLTKYYPDYAEKLSSVATFVIELTQNAQLGSVCNGAASSYKVFTKGWIAYVICLGIIIILILIMILSVNVFEKKYPIPAAPKVKIAVFGKEFEDIDENDIIVDIKRNDDDSDPFDI